MPLVVSLFAPEKRQFTPSVLWAISHQPDRCYRPHLFVVFGLIWLVLFGCTWNIVRGPVGLRDEIVALKQAQE